MNKDFSPKKEKTPNEIRFDILLDELEIKQATFEKEAKMRLHKIDEHLESLKHNVLVAEHDMKEDMYESVRKIKKAADAILLPDDVL